MKQLTFGTLSLLALLSSCAVPTQGTEIDAYIQSLDKLPAEPPALEAGPVSSPQDEGDYSCTTQNFLETRRFDEIVAFAANSDSLYPGAILRGDSVYSGLFTQTVFPRKPLTFSVSLESLSGSHSATMEEPSLSVFRDRLSDILSAEVNGATPANIFSEIEEVNSKQQLALAMGAEASWGGLPLNISGSFNFNNENVRSRYVVKFVQSFYTVDIDQPAKPSDFFGDSVSQSEIEQVFNDENPPVYVSSITYGRTVFFTFESEFSKEELNSALQFAYAGGPNVSGNVSLTYDEMLERTHITAYILGGSGGDAVQAISGFEELKSFIQNGGNYSKDNPGAPIAYKLKHLADNSPARMSLTDDYDVKDCVRVSQKVRATVDSITVTAVGSDEVGSGSDLEIYGDIYLFGNNFDLIFSRLRDQALVINEGQTFTLSGGSLGEAIIDVTPQPGNSIECYVDFFERDNFGDDTFPEVFFNATFEGGWRRQVPLLVTGGSSQIIVRISLHPI